MKDLLLKFNQRAAGNLQNWMGTDGCQLGANVNSVVTVSAVISRRAEKQDSAPGGMEFVQAPVATVIKIDGLNPKQGWLFYDGQKWWLVDDCITADHTAEWKLVLKPLSKAEQ
jgi:hypothetical protein